MNFQNGKHSIGGSNYHLQFTPKYRREVFKSMGVRNLCKAAFKKKARELGVNLESVEFGPDHVHLFVTNCKNFSASKLAFYFKGASSFYIRKHNLPIVKQKLWGKSFWSDGYFYETVGRVTAETVKFYIERQQKKHWQNTNHIRSIKNGKAIQTKIDKFTSKQIN